MQTPPRQKFAALWFLLALAALPWFLSGCGKPPAAKDSPPVPTVAPPSPALSPPIEGIRFESVAESVGIDCRWPPQPRPMRVMEAFGTGCAFLDYDNDGWQDVLLVTVPHIRLYHNRGDGHFEDVTEAAGLTAIQGDWKGVAVGDFDGDGFLDLALTGYRRFALLKNLGGKRFVDVTKEAGFDPANKNHWGSSVGFMDLAGKGRLDLVLLNYVIFGPKEKQTCEMGGVVSGCPPATYRPEFGELWENLGSGRFRDVTATSGMRRTHGKALVLAFADVYGDGRMDFYIGNDGMPAELMQNQGGMRFNNLCFESGLAYGSLNHPVASMGADWGDYDRDGRLDLVITGFSDEPYTLFHALGKGVFEQTQDATGIAGPTYKPLGFGDKWIDMDNDGWLDIIFVNGHVYDRVNEIDPFATFRQPMMLFHNEQGKQFTDLVPKMGGSVAEPLLGRGLATGDYDNDGRVDFLVVDYEGKARLFHNVSPAGNHWITLDLRGAGANKFAYGAQVLATAHGQKWAGQVSPASSYLSSSDPRVHFGLGDTVALESVAIRWPDGRREVLKNVAADRLLRIEEGQGKTSVWTAGRWSASPISQAY